MGPKLQFGAGFSKTSETAVIRSMKELMKDYETRADKYESSVAKSILKQFKKALEDDRLVTKFLVDPQDRRLVEYWDDDKFVDAFSTELDDAALKKKKKIRTKIMKEDKPLAKLLPLIDAIRARRYTHITELDVWDCHLENDDSYALSGIISRNCYPISHLELLDCFLDDRSLNLICVASAASKNLRELCLDFNHMGESGCRILCLALRKARFLVHLSLSYCGLTKHCGLWLGTLITETAIRELILDGNPLEAEGVIALLSQLSEAAEHEGFERIDEFRRKEQAIYEARRAARPNLDMQEQNTSANESKPTSPASSESTELAGRDRGPKLIQSKKKTRRRGKRGARNEPPPAGPQISVLKLADTGINHMGKGGSFAPVRCMQLLKSIITHSKDLQEIDLFANEVGDLGARQILEGLLARKENKLPQIGVRMGHRINQDTFDIIHKLAPGPKKKKGKGKKTK